MLHNTKRMPYEAAWKDLAGEAAAMDAGKDEIASVGAIAGGENWRDALARLDAAELRIVRRCVAPTRFRLVRSVTLAVNLLGNGWIYAPVAIAILLSGMPHAHAVLATAVLAAASAHALYALLKCRVARLRPFEKDRALTPLARALDRYSFPSGHCMTLTAVLTPIAHAVPACWPPAIGALAALAWCRLASAHHYPSDVMAGICIGIATALPLSAWLLPA